MYKGGLLIAITSSSSSLELWLDDIQKSVGSYVIIAYYHMKYVFLLSIWLGHLKWQPAV